MDEELLTTTLPKKQNGATKSIMRPSRKTAEEKSRAKILEASQNNGNFSSKLFHEPLNLLFGFCRILNHFLSQNQIIKRDIGKAIFFIELFFGIFIYLQLDIIK